MGIYYYGNLDQKNICDNRKFWKTVKPLITNSTNRSEKILLTEGDTILKKESEIAESLNDFFSNIVRSLNISKYTCTKSNSSDPIIKTIEKYEHHPSIITIKNKCKDIKPFSFEILERNELLKEIRKLNTKKSSQESDIPTKIIKENAEIFTDFILSSLNDSITKGHFPDILKKADITPIFKKGSRNIKENYRPISILPNISKIFERPLFDQITTHFDQILSPYQCGFRKGFSTQHCLLAMLEKWKVCNDKKLSFGALLTDLSKAFDCLSHELLIAKLHAYGFSYNALKLVSSYLTNRKQRTKCGTVYSTWKEILTGVPQGSILGPLLFNVFLCDLFFDLEKIDFSNFADDITPYCHGQDVEEVIHNLEKTATDLFEWFNNNEMRANPEKFQLILNSKSKHKLMLGEASIMNSNQVKLLGINIDDELTFKEHINQICKTASCKLVVKQLVVN